MAVSDADCSLSMHLLTILCFALLFWRGELAGPWPIIGNPGVAGTWGLVLVQPFVLGFSALAAARRAGRMATDPCVAAQRAHVFQHRVTVGLRLALMIGFALTVLGTPWVSWFAFGRHAPVLQIFGDVAVLSPFFVGAVALWLGSYPYERMVRRQAIRILEDRVQADGWSVWTYLDFNVRHQLLVVAIPMSLILFAAGLVRAYEGAIVQRLGGALAPDVVLGSVAAVVFVAAPLLLRRIWRTTPLPDGPLRRRLEELCRRIDLRCRDILVWKSDGYMINAAVMGVFAPVRFVLLSDALLAAMTPAQVEAVFGHEAGHVRHHHIPHFLGFAFVGWVVVIAIMELLARRASLPNSALAGASWTVEGVGIAATILFWGIGFGWVSRRFERQADLFGARCAAPPNGRCDWPCSVHLDEHTVRDADRRVCASGAAVFAAALDRVALLNGIPREERSWRHSSIANRIGFLASAAGDPKRAVAFERRVRGIKLAIWTAAAAGAVLTVGYWAAVSQPALLRLQAGV